MINPRRQITALLVAIAAVFSLLCVARLATGNRPPDLRGTRLFELPFDDVDRVFLDFGGELPAIDLRKVDGIWQMLEPLRGDASRTWISRFLDACEGARIREAFTLPEEAKDYQRFGLERPARLTPDLTLGAGSRAITCRLGAAIPLIELSECYARLVPGETIITLPIALREALPDAAADIRPRHLLQEEPRHVTTMEWRAPGRPYVRLTRADGTWQVSQPITLPLENSHVLDVLRKLAQTPVERYLAPAGDEPESEAAFRARLARYGLDDEQALQLQIRSLERRAPIRLRFGKIAAEDPSCVYALLDRQPLVLLVNRATLDLVGEDSLFALRNRRVFTGFRAPGALSYRTGATQVDLVQANGQWLLKSPIENKADNAAVDSLLTAIANLRGDLLTPAYGLISISPDSGTALASVKISEGETATAFTLYRPTDDQETLHLRLNTQGPDFALPATNIPPALLEGALDPSLISRTILSVPSGLIRRVTVVREGTTETIARDHEQSAWRLENSVSQYLNEEVLDAWINAFADLRAEKVVHQFTASRDQLTAFGLATPWLEITLDVETEGALRKTLLLGQRLPLDGGCYAMVRGHDLVYLLDSRTTQLLERPLGSE